jgi:hypothetical protein
MWDHGPERRSGQDRRQGDRRHHERRQYQRRASGAEKPFFEVVPGRRKKADRRSGVDRRQGERRQWVRRHADVAALENKLVLRDGMYAFPEQVVGLPEGPFCTRCFDLDRKLVPVARNIELSRRHVTYVCPRCGAVY